MKNVNFFLKTKEIFLIYVTFLNRQQREREPSKVLVQNHLSINLSLTQKNGLKIIKGIEVLFIGFKKIAEKRLTVILFGWRWLPQSVL